MDRRMHEIEGGLDRELGALLGSVNFSGYTDRARLRGDDLAVRNVASQRVLEAKQLVGAAISAWWNAEAGEPTRENPFPKPEVNKKLRELRTFEQSLAEMENAIRGAVVPDLDAVWNLRTDGTAMLQTLLGLDKTLLERARELAESARGVSAQQLSGEEQPFASIAHVLADLGDVARQRREFISGM